MRQITTEIEINASSDKVWAVLTNFKKYPDWNHDPECDNAELFLNSIRWLSKLQ